MKLHRIKTIKLSKQRVQGKGNGKILSILNLKKMIEKFCEIHLISLIGVILQLMKRN